jgi:hypothetical protein
MLELSAVPTTMLLPSINRLHAGVLHTTVKLPPYFLPLLCLLLHQLAERSTAMASRLLSGEEETFFQVLYLSIVQL